MQSTNSFAEKQVSLVDYFGGENEVPLFISKRTIVSREIENEAHGDSGQLVLKLKKLKLIHLC